MVVASLSLGALTGILLSGGFIYVEIGRYATPQVKSTLFEERREVFAYTAGLFAGVLLALPFLFFLAAMGDAALPGALLFLGVLLAGNEIAQWALLRSTYFGSTASAPFYAMGFRLGIGGILVLALVTQDLSGPAITPLGIGLMLAQSVAVTLLEVTGALQSLPRHAPEGQLSGGGRLSAVLIGAIGFFLVGYATLLGGALGIVAALIAVAGAGLLYARLRLPLARIPPPAGTMTSSTVTTGASYGRTDR